MLESKMAVGPHRFNLRGPGVGNFAVAHAGIGRARAVPGLNMLLALYSKAIQGQA